jgi:hypothetical protein
MNRIGCALTAVCLLWMPLWMPSSVPPAFAAPAPSAVLQTTELSGVVHLRGHLDEKRLVIAAPGAAVPHELSARVDVAASIASALLSVEHENAVLATVFLEPGARVITLPLEHATVRDGHVTLTVRLVLTPGSPACNVLSTHCVDLDRITLSFAKGDRPSEALLDTWPSTLKSTEIYVASSPSLTEATAALTVSAQAARGAFGQDIAVAVRPLESSVSTLVSSSPFSRVVVVAGEAEADRHIGEETQMVGGHQATLAQLGLPAIVIRGPRQHEATVMFSQADLGGPVSGLTFHLSGTYTPAPPRSGARVMVLMNGRLIWSFGPDQRGRFDVSGAVPPAVIERDNTLTLRVSAGAAEHDPADDPFEVAVDPGSAVVISRGQTLRPGFDRFPQAFLPRFLVSFDRLAPDTLEAAAQLIAAMQRTTRAPLRPEVVSWDDALHSAKPWLAVVTDYVNARSLSAPLDLAPFRLTDRDHRELVRMDAHTPLAALEAFARGHRDILLLTHRAHRQGLLALTHDLQAQGGWYGVSGNVWLAPDGRPPFGLRVGDAGMRVESLIGSDRETNALRDAVVVLVLLALTAVLVWAYPKTVRPHPRTARALEGIPSRGHAESRA